MMAGDAPGSETACVDAQDAGDLITTVLVKRESPHLTSDFAALAMRHG